MGSQRARPARPLRRATEAQAAEGVARRERAGRFDLRGGARARARPRARASAFSASRRVAVSWGAPRSRAGAGDRAGASRWRSTERRARTWRGSWRPRARRLPACAPPSLGAWLWKYRPYAGMCVRATPRRRAGPSPPRHASPHRHHRCPTHPMIARDCTLASPELAPRTGRRALPPYRTPRTAEPLCRLPSPGGALLHPHGALTLSSRARAQPPAP